MKCEGRQVSYLSYNYKYGVKLSKTTLPDPKRMSDEYILSLISWWYNRRMAKTQYLGNDIWEAVTLQVGDVFN